VTRSDRSFAEIPAPDGPVVTDGAMGTEFLRHGHGIETRDWVGATFGEPGEVRAIHRSYTD
jgi:methionine synthase I (cobalamin-dependent)